MKILVLDNYDSFTYNLVHMIKELGYNDIIICRNDKINLDGVEAYDKILLSPGPGIPSEAGLLLPLIKKYASRKPILGVCLGHQAIAEAFGGKLVNLKNVFHGVSSAIHINNPNYLFQQMNSNLEVGRYHSWIVERESLPSSLEILAEDDLGQIMALRHKKYDVQGVQFHPESILTPEGHQIILNFLQHEN